MLCTLYNHLVGLMCNSQCAMCNAETHLKMRPDVLKVQSSERLDVQYMEESVILHKITRTVEHIG